MSRAGAIWPFFGHVRSNPVAVMNILPTSSNPVAVMNILPTSSNPVAVIKTIIKMTNFKNKLSNHALLILEYCNWKWCLSIGSQSYLPASAGRSETAAAAEHEWKNYDDSKIKNQYCSISASQVESRQHCHTQHDGTTSHQLDLYPPWTCRPRQTSQDIISEWFVSTHVR